MPLTNAVEICNSALLLIGADEISDFTEETREAQVCNQIYTTIRNTTLQKYPWRFSLTLRQLAQLAVTPPEAEEFGFEFAYQLPSDSLRVIRTADAGDDYLIFQNLLFTNNDEVFVEYQQAVDESQFPDYFRSALELVLAERLALTLEDQLGKYQLLQQAALRELAIAKNIDAQEQPVADVGDNNFLFTLVRT